jgi:hypothetical protein
LGTAAVRLSTDRPKGVRVPQPAQNVRIRLVATNAVQSKGQAFPRLGVLPGLGYGVSVRRRSTSTIPLRPFRASPCRWQEKVMVHLAEVGYRLLFAWSARLVPCRRSALVRRVCSDCAPDLPALQAARRIRRQQCWPPCHGRSRRTYVRLLVERNGLSKSFGVADGHPSPQQSCSDRAVVTRMQVRRSRRDGLTARRSFRNSRRRRRRRRRCRRQVAQVAASEGWVA